MKRPLRIALSGVISSLAAAALPVYPRRREIRSYRAPPVVFTLASS